MNFYIIWGFQIFFLGVGGERGSSQNWTTLGGVFLCILGSFLNFTSIASKPKTHI